MGTRHITAVFIDGEYKIAQYGQWDGYPEGQGKTALETLRRITRTQLDADEFKRKVRSCVWMSDEEVKAEYTKAGADPNADWVSMEVADRFKAANPQIDRDMGAKILEFVAENEPGVKLRNEIDFVADSLFCEYAYVVDFDNGTFEVFKGFNHDPLAKGERFEAMDNPEMREKGYFPVRLLASFPLDGLPTEEEFLEATTEKEEAEADQP